VIAERTLSSLGKKRRVVPGAVNKLASFVLGQMLPRSAAVAILGKSTAALT
jgi:hypothetical protein